MAHATARPRLAAAGQAAHLRSPDRALAGAAGHARGIRSARRAAVPVAEDRLGAADARVPVAVLHRISAVSGDADPVCRELAGTAPVPDHDVRRSCFAATHL